MTDLSKRLKEDNQLFRAIYNYLSQVESEIDYKELGNNSVKNDPISNRTEFYDMVIDVSIKLKSNSHE